jgi:uncharacterized protein (TIGR04255 family)
VPKLRHPPVIYVVAQVAFTPVLALKKQLPKIQHAFQGIGFPRYQEGELATVRVGGGSGPTITTKPRWDFSNRDKDTGITLTESTVAVATSRYETYEEFANQLEQVAVAEPVGGALVERIGLRYIDLVRVTPDESFDKYVAKELLGFWFDGALETPDSARGFRTESLSQTRVGTLAVRCYQLPPPQFLPNDLLPITLSFDPLLGTARSVTLDFDHFTNRSIDFDVAGIVHIAGELHDPLSRAFEQATTPYARERWNRLERV